MITPDGERVVYTISGAESLYVRALSELDATLLETPNATPSAPFVSPDGARVGFYDNVDDRLMWVSIRGGGPVFPILPDGSPQISGASWGENDTIIFGTRRPSGLWEVPASGGEATLVTLTEQDGGEVNHAWPHILPGGRAVLFTIFSGSSLAEIALFDLDTGEQRVLVPGGSNPRYAASGHIVYGVSGTLWAVAFDLTSLKVTDAIPTRVLDGVVMTQRGAAAFDLARDGSLVYITGDAIDEAAWTLVWVDREGDEQPLGLPAADYFWPRVSDDGNYFAVIILDPEREGVWISKVASPYLRQITTNSERDGFAPSRVFNQVHIWKPDSMELLVFPGHGREPDGASGFFSIRVDDLDDLTDRDENPFSWPALTDQNLLLPWSFSPNGMTLLFGHSGSTERGSKRDVGLLNLESVSDWEPLLDSESGEDHPQISPSGVLIAYTSDHTGEREVYVDTFPIRSLPTDVSGPTDGGGRAPHWSRTGDELFYLRLDGAMMVARVFTEPSLHADQATHLFDGIGYKAGGTLVNYDLDLSRESGRERFLVVKTTSDQAATAEPIFILNWFDELQRLVPSP